MIRDLMLAGRELAGYTDARIRRGLAWSVGEALFAAVPSVLVYLLLEDVLLGRASLSRTLLLAALLLAALMGRLWCGTRAMPALFSGAYAMMAQARLRIADHLRRLPMGWFARQRSGSLAATLAADLQQVEDIWAHFIGVFFGGLLAPLLLSAVLLWLDWRLGLVVIATMPCAFGLLLLGQYVLVAQAGKLHAANALGQAQMLDYVQGIAVIRAFEGSRGGASLQRLSKALDGMRRSALAIELWPAPALALYGFAIEAGFALVVWVGARRLGISLDAATLLLFAVLSLPIYRQLLDVGQSFLLLRYARQAMQRIRALLAERPLMEPVQGRPPQHDGIELDAVSFSYGGDGGEVALHEISARLPARRLTAIVGPSGSGKTTLVHLIARLWDVNRGAIRIGGVDVREIGSEHLHGQVSMVFQDVVLFSGSVFDNIRLGKPNANLEQVMAAARLAQAHDFIERLPQGYATQLGENGARLSGGERQRLSIARALLKNAPILLLDEATASMDASNAVRIQSALTALVANRTVVVIAHRLASVCQADHILVLDRGRLVDQGRHEDLLARGGVYAHLWACQEAAQQWEMERQGHA